MPVRKRKLVSATKMTTAQRNRKRKLRQLRGIDRGELHRSEKRMRDRKAGIRTRPVGGNMRKKPIPTPTRGDMHKPKKKRGIMTPKEKMISSGITTYKKKRPLVKTKSTLPLKKFKPTRPVGGNKRALPARPKRPTRPVRRRRLYKR